MKGPQNGSEVSKSPLTFILDIAIRGAYIASVAAMGLKHFSRLREFHLADVPTLGNAASGVGAILFSLLFMESRSPGHFFAGTACTPAALIFDWFDGRLARWRRHHSALGRELDSLADIISFGVAPAVLAFAAGLRGAWDWLALIYFVCCGVSRLARYNVTAETLSAGGDKVAYFEGTPIPTTFLLTAMLAMAASVAGRRQPDLQMPDTRQSH
jgi:CDP-diacylglycerol---serine O-phosphatidyltransferase